MTPNEVRWCCIGFKSAYTIGPHRGVNAVLTSRKQPLRFALHFRPVEPRDLDALRASRLPFETSLVIEMVIVYCPWCGEDLDKKYHKQIAGLEALHPLVTLELPDLPGPPRSTE